jgi:ribonuclease HI
VPESPLTVVAYADGASKGNPGPSSFGAVVYDEKGNELQTRSQALGVGTNNQAEYEGAIAALNAALALGANEVTLRMDSQLVVRQVEGSYRVRNEKLIPLHKRLVDLSRRFEQFAIEHVPRAQNKVADRLANDALK